MVAAAALGAHLASLAGVIAQRRRPLELLHAFVLASGACLVIAAASGALAGLAPVGTVTRIRLVSVEVFALAAWGLAIVGHTHKIVPFIAWSSQRARGVTTARREPAALRPPLRPPSPGLPCSPLSPVRPPVICGLANGNAPTLRAGGLALAFTGVLATANLGLGPCRAAQPRP